MKLVGSNGQAVPHLTFDASGTIVSGAASQLILPRRFSTSHLVVMNLSPTLPMYLEFGSARATATITNGAVSAVTVTNAGFGFSQPPSIQFRGGGAGMFPGFLGCADPNSPSPSAPARAHAVMSGSAPNQTVSSIVIDYAGTGYLTAPYVLIQNSPNDPLGCADPSIGGGSGIFLGALGGSYYLNGTVCPTDQMALYCANGAAARFTCKWTD